MNGVHIQTSTTSTAANAVLLSPRKFAPENPTPRSIAFSTPNVGS